MSYENVEGDELKVRFTDWVQRFQEAVESYLLTILSETGSISNVPSSGVDKNFASDLAAYFQFVGPHIYIARELQLGANAIHAVLLRQKLVATGTFPELEEEIILSQYLVFATLVRNAQQHDEADLTDPGEEYLQETVALCRRALLAHWATLSALLLEKDQFKSLFARNRRRWNYQDDEGDFETSPSDERGVPGNPSVSGESQMSCDPTGKGH